MDGTRQVTFDETLDGINPRCKLAVRVTNYWWADGSPEYGKAKRLTPAQALAEYRTYHPQGSTHFTSFEAVDAQGRVYSIVQLRFALREGNEHQKMLRQYHSARAAVTRDGDHGFHKDTSKYL